MKLQFPAGSACEGLIQRRQVNESIVISKGYELSLINQLDEKGEPLGSAPYVCVGHVDNHAVFLLKEIVNMDALQKFFQQQREVKNEEVSKNCSVSNNCTHGYEL